MFNNFDFSSPWNGIQIRSTSRKKAAKNQQTPSLSAMPSGGDNNEVTGTAAAMAQCQQPVSIAAPAAVALQQQLQVQQIVVPDHLADAEVSQLTSSLGMEDAFMESAQPRSTATLAVNVAADSAFQTPRSGSGRMVQTLHS